MPCFEKSNYFDDSLVKTKSSNKSTGTSRGHMNTKSKIFILLLGMFFSQTATAGEHPFDAWLADFKNEAITKGISKKTLDGALTGLKPIPRIIELDRRQPEFTLTFRDYMERMVNDKRIVKARAMLSKNRELLNKVSKKYGVQPQYLISFWGLETDFGRLASGYFPVVGALATLAHDGRRGKFFRNQLINALRILDGGHIDLARMKGSWAGAMGHFQFIPTTFNAYAVDFDGDGKRDIWTNKKDAFASAANFLSNSGWKEGEIWGREVKVGDGFDFTNASLKIKKPLADWQALGVRRVDGRNLPKADVVASLLAPAGHVGPKFLVYGNFRTTMRWNQSQFYALAIGHLADRIIGKGPLTTLGPRDGKSLSFVQSEQLQQLLIDAGYDPGPADGIIGSKTRDAIRSYQKDKGMVPDGHPSLEILSHIKGS